MGAIDGKVHSGSAISTFSAAAVVPSAADTNSIEHEALLNAKSFVKSRFTTLESLDELHDIASYYQSHLSLAKSDLQSSSDDHDEFVTVVRQDVMNKLAEMASLKNEMKRLDQELRTCRQRFGGLRQPKMHHVASAAENIQHTIECFDQIHSTVSQAEHIQRGLDHDSRPLSDICRDVMELEGFALRLVQATAATSASGACRHNSLPQSLPDTTDSKYQCPLACEYESATKTDVIRDPIHAVLELSGHLRQKVQDIVSRCVEVGQSNPLLLEQAVEALVLIEESDSANCDVFSLDGKEAFQQICLRLANEAVSDHIQQTFTGYIYNRADAGESGVDIILGAASRALSKIIVLQRDLEPCFPFGFGFECIFQDQCGQYIYPQVSALYSQSLRTLEVRDILSLVVWIDDYKQQLNRLEPTVQLSQEVESGLDLLLGEYENRIKKQTSTWLHNIRERERELHCDDNGHLITNDPEDMLNIFDMHQSVADEFLSSSCYASRAAFAYLEALETSLIDTQEEIDRDFASLGVESMCSLANDYVRLSESIESISDRLDYSIRAKDDLSSSLERVCNRCVEVAHQATRRISDCIIFDIKEEYLTKIGTKLWEDGFNAVVVVTQTLQDYFGDLKVWLPEFFLTKMIRRCLGLVLNTYIEAFYSNLAQKKTRFSDCAQASRVLAGDHELLLVSFAAIVISVVDGSRVDVQLRDIRERLDILKCMSTLLSLNDPDAAKDMIDTFLLEFGSKAGLDAVMNLVSLQHSFDAETAANWLSAIDSVKNKDGACITPEKYKAPAFGDGNAGSGSSHTCTSRKRHCAGNWTVSRQIPRRMKRWRKDMVRRRLSF